MFERATKYFTELYNSAEYKNKAKCFSGGVLVTEAQAICQHENVWTWSPSDVEELTIVRMPQQPMPCAESIMVVYEKFFHKEIGKAKPVKEVWYCDCTHSLDSCLATITNNFLL
jgi:hypothetical protein|tara:strand:+ start:206 stop:547 length:342 start_codon:yes stop_codon:yes gene_type:complete